MRSTWLVLIFVAAACGARHGNGKGEHGDGGTSPGPGVLLVSPASATVATGGQAMFTAMSGTKDVTAQAMWAVGDTTLGTFLPGGIFMAGTAHGGTSMVTATLGNAMGTASVSVQLSTSLIDPSAPMNAPSAFPGTPSTDVTETPALVYPFDGTMFARNLTNIAIQWTRSAKDTLFRLHFSGATEDFSFYVGSGVCNAMNQCTYVAPDASWLQVAQSAGSGLTFTIDGTAAVGQPVASSTSIKVDFSPDDVQGGVYYFSPRSQSGANGASIERVPFGAKMPTTFIPNGNSYGCVGCHAVSRDGKKVFAEFEGADGIPGIVDGANGQSYIVTPGTAIPTGDFGTFSPDGTKIIVNAATGLTLRDSTTGAVIITISPSFYPSYKGVAMPEWSPDGNSIVMVGIPMEGGGEEWNLDEAGDIIVMPYNNGAFGTVQVIVPSVSMMTYNFYPTWSPDSKWIAFASSDYPGGNGVPAGSYNQPHARLRLARATPMSTPIELTNATHVMNKTSSWPKFSPFIQGSLTFFTFNAEFDYGFVIPNNTAQPQLWMSAINLSKADQGTGDPSYAPFWLPFQDPTTNNHSAVWTEMVQCTQPTDCPSGYTCTNGQCAPIIQ